MKLAKRTGLLAGGVVLFLASAGSSHAGAPVTWVSSRGSVVNPIVNLQSDGITAIDSTFRFELGAFKALPDGSAFDPTSSNVDQWEAQWCSIGTPAVYNEAPNSFFTRSADLDSNGAPFGAGEAAYIWGYDTRQGGGEWLLVRRDDWIWPSAVGGGGINPVRTSYSISINQTGYETIVGAINGSGFLMRTEAINFSTGLTTYAQWVIANFTAAEQADPMISGENADPDHDGFSNLFEFATGSLPKDGASFPEVSLETTSAGEVSITVSENPNAAVSWALEFSTDLDSWEGTVPAEIGTSDLIAGIRTFVDPVLFAGVERRFLRLAVTRQ